MDKLRDELQKCVKTKKIKGVVVGELLEQGAAGKSCAELIVFSSCLEDS